MPQRRQAPPQQPQLRQQQQHGSTPQPEPKGAGEGTDFAVEGRAVLQHREHQRCLTLGGLPGDGIADRQEGLAGPIHRLVAPLTGLLAAPERWLQAQGRGRLPLIPAQHVVYARVQAGTRKRQARLRKLWRHHQRSASIEFGSGQQQVDGALQPAEIGRLHAFGIRTLHRQPRAGHKCQQYHRSTQK
ncbi:MAG: hypothetical protein B7X56_00360, partial [Burkholderiales bacterium 34-67-9]